jgi:hypothetical protein
MICVCTTFFFFLTTVTTKYIHTWHMYIILLKNVKHAIRKSMTIINSPYFLNNSRILASWLNSSSQLRLKKKSENNKVTCLLEWKLASWLFAFDLQWRVTLQNLHKKNGGKKKERKQAPKFNCVLYRRTVERNMTGKRLEM